jgi:hypothetical protein
VTDCAFERSGHTVGKSTAASKLVMRVRFPSPALNGSARQAVADPVPICTTAHAVPLACPFVSLVDSAHDRPRERPRASTPSTTSQRVRRTWRLALVAWKFR